MGVGGLIKRFCIVVDLSVPDFDYSPPLPKSAAPLNQFEIIETDLSLFPAVINAVGKMGQEFQA